MGASLGGLVVDHLGLMHTPWLGALVVLGALGLTVLSGRLDRRDGVGERADGVVVVAH
jgi:DHA1 family inner membrane transport protein